MSIRSIHSGYLAVAVFGFSFAIAMPVASADDDATACLGEIERRIMAAWKLPPKGDGLKVTLRYTLARNGSVSFVRMENTSGNPSFDESAVRAVKRASPFPPPPNSFPIGDLRMVLDPRRPTPSKSAPKKDAEQRI